MINSEYSLNIIKLNVLLVGAKLRVICLEYFFNMVTSSDGWFHIIYLLTCVVGEKQNQALIFFC